MERRRITFVLPSFAGGGAERVLLTLLGSLDQQQFERRLVVVQGNGPLSSAVPPGVMLRDLGHSRLRSALRPLVAELRSHPPDIIVSTIGYVNLAVLGLRPLLASTSRIVVREANAPQATFDAFSQPWLARLGYRLLYRRAAAVLCPTHIIRAALQETCSVPAKLLVVMPNPVDEALLRQRATAPRRQPGPGKRFVTAGRFTHQKGLDRLIELFSSLDDPAAHLTILGDGPDRPALSVAVRDHNLQDRISLPGFVRDPWSYYSGSDAVLLASRWEGMPNVALEALALGVPVIATPESGGVTELATETPAGAITVAAFGTPYREALARVRPRTPGLGPSLLPPRFNREAVARQFSDILARV